MTPSKISGSVKGIVKEPIDIIKKGLKTAIKPATSEGTGAIFVGAVLSAPVGYLYKKAFDMLVAKFPTLVENTVLAKIVQFGLPLLPIYFVRKFNVPFGNLINGTLLGIFVMQIVLEVWSLVGGSSLLGSKTVVTESATIETEYGEF